MASITRRIVAKTAATNPFGCCRRWIFSKTGQWITDLTPEVMKDVERHWRPRVQKTVSEAQAKIPESKKFYVLSMFPYPSGQLHMGHVRVYSISDAMAHYYRMRGYRVLHPMGWDGFGLPAENAAIDRNVDPDVWTKENVASMKEQLEAMGFTFDWDREIATCDPNYYKWTQWIFLQMFKNGLAYQKEAMVNWDPVDQTVLADEQVDETGRSWRSGAKVERRPLKQWFLRTTEFSKELSDGLDDPSLENWRDIVKIQKHWIGDCLGTRFRYDLEAETVVNGNNHQSLWRQEVLSVWTDHPLEAAHGPAFILLSSDHVLNKEHNFSSAEDSSNEIFSEALGTRLRRLSAVAIDPFDRSRKIPVFALQETAASSPTSTSSTLIFPPGSDSVLGLPTIFPFHGTLARDLDLSKGHEGAQEQKFSSIDEVMTLARKGKFGGNWTSSKLQDWLISRQRYWGTPIPVVHCDNCRQAVPVSEECLPVLLPPMTEGYKTKGGTESPLASASKDWVNTTCPRCSGPARRETDTMDTFVDSSWYFLRYLDPHNGAALVDKVKADQVMPVDLYVGGKEHATLHLFFARFVARFLHSIGVCPVKEPFRSLLVQGMVKGQSFRVKGTGRYLSRAEVDMDEQSQKAVEKGTKAPLVVEWEKMSKSKLNGADPAQVLDEYGTDITRLLILSDVSPLSDRKWDPADSYVRVRNMIFKIASLVHHAKERQENLSTIPRPDDQKVMTNEQKIWDARNFYLRGINHAYDMTRNLAMVLSRIQGLLGELNSVHGYVKATSPQFQRALGEAIIALAPLAPNLSSELWAGLASVPTKTWEGFSWDKSVLEQDWPELDPNYNLKLVLKKNGEEIHKAPISVWRFANLTEEDAFNLACCINEVQDQVLPFKFTKSFTKEPNYEAVLEFIMGEDRTNTLNPEELKRLQEAKREQKRLKKERREAKIAEVKAREMSKSVPKNS